MATVKSNPPRQVDVESLPFDQLSSVKKQLDDELEHLTLSFSKLRAAQGKFRDCVRSVQNKPGPESADQHILVPFTTSLYIPGVLVESDLVTVDVGTGFLVEKSTKDAIAFYERKIAELEDNLRDLEQILQGKSTDLRAVEDVLRRKVVASNQNS